MSSADAVSSHLPARYDRTLTLIIMTGVARFRNCRNTLFPLMLLACVLAASCGPGQQPHGTAGAEQPAPPAAAAKATSTVASYDLAADEALGGHTLARHVGKSDAQLAARLRAERQISAASTYPDAGTASRVVAATVAAG